jgi:hypothetical protein
MTKLTLNAVLANSHYGLAPIWPQRDSVNATFSKDELKVIPGKRGRNSPCSLVNVPFSATLKDCLDESRSSLLSFALGLSLCSATVYWLQPLDKTFHMAPRKRGRDEMESSEPPTETSLLRKIRNMWEFACVMQYIFTFGKAVKIDEDFDIEVFATTFFKFPQYLASRLGKDILRSGRLIISVRNSKMSASSPSHQRNSKKSA